MNRFRAAIRCLQKRGVCYRLRLYNMHLPDQDALIADCFFERKEPLVKIEEVKQQPVERRWQLLGSAVWNSKHECYATTLTEPEAREIYEYFDKEFGPLTENCSWTYHYKKVAEFEAEIARLKGWLKKIQNQNFGGSWQAYRALAGEKVPE